MVCESLPFPHSLVKVLMDGLATTVTRHDFTVKVSACEPEGDSLRHFSAHAHSVPNGWVVRFRPPNAGPEECSWLAAVYAHKTNRQPI